MGKADRLSRRPDWKIEVKKDNNNQVFIKNCWLHSLQEVVLEGPEVSYPKLQNMSEICLTLIQHQIPMDIWSYLCPKLGR